MNFEVLLANELTSYYSIDKGVVNDDYIVFHTIFINKMLHG